MSGIGLAQKPVATQKQKLVLTQELRLLLNLLQMTTVELKGYLEEQLIENPALEEEPRTNDAEETSSLLGELPEGLPDHHYSPDYSARADDVSSWENRIPQPDSLFEHLNWQLSMADFSKRQKEIASLVIGNVNEDGYLEIETSEILQTLASAGETGSEEKDLEEIERVIAKIRTTFDPVGTGSRSLSECLRAQAADLGYGEKSLVAGIIENHMDDLGEKNYDKIAAELNTDREKILEAEAVITSLEPKPGRPYYTSDTARKIVPDFYVHRVGDDLQIQSNGNFPKIRISSYCRKILADKKNLTGETATYLREKIEAARRIVRGVEEREATMRKVMEKIVSEQREFFDHGISHLKPLRLKDVAEPVGIHESTVSRITSRKHIQCPQGIVELKKLFSRGVSTSRGKRLSLEKVKVMIKEIVDNEPEQYAFSDEDISRILSMKNIKVARRTVAKHRKVLGIPSSSKRLSKEA